MTVVKIKIAAALVLTASVLTAGTGLLMLPGRSPPPAVPSVAEAEPPKPPEIQKPRKDCYGDDLPPGALARLGTVRFRQGNCVLALDLSPDGRRLITVGGNNRLHLWDVATGKEIHHFPEDRTWTTTHAAVFSPDGRTFATGSRNGFSLWESSTGKRLYTVAGVAVDSLVFSPDGKTLATSWPRNWVTVWDVASGQKIAELKEIGALPDVPWRNGPFRKGWHALAFAPDGRMLASTFENNVILWDLATRQEIRRLVGHVKPVQTTSFSPDGKLLASAGEDKTIRLWDPASGREMRQLKGHEARIWSLVFSPDGKTLFSGSGTSIVFAIPTPQRRDIRLWDVATGKECAPIAEHIDGGNALAVSRDGKLLVASAGGSVRMWDLAAQQEIRRYTGHQDWIGGVAFSPDGQRVATGGGDLTVRLWDALSGRQLRSFTVGDAADSVAFSPDGRLIAAGSRDGFIQLWNAATGREVRRYRAHERETCLAFSPDGTRLASASRDTTAAVWDVATGAELRRFKADYDGFGCVTYSPDGKRIAAGEIDSYSRIKPGMNPDLVSPFVRIWDVTNGKQIHCWQVHKSSGVCGVAFSPDGAVLATTGWDRKTRLWDAATGRALDQIPSGQMTVVFSPDGRMLATVGSDHKVLDNTVRLWELATLKERAQFVGHSASIHGLAFSPDGRTLASTSMDTTALLWDVRGKVLSADLKTCWQALAGADAAKAYQAINGLCADPEQAMPLLCQQLRPVHSPDPQQMARLVADLDNDRFEVRERAVKQIEDIGELAKPLLQNALASKPSLEVRRRVEQLLVNIESARSPQQLRALRAVEVLENIGTPEARRVLQTLARGAAEARLTRDAKASLERLRVHSPSGR